MNPPDNPEPSGPVSREELMSALFANVVIQNSNLAMMFLGRVPHPETGKPEIQLESARLFIDTLDMLESKTRGNLTPEEAGLLKQKLTELRLIFVETLNRSGAPGEHPPAERAAESQPGSVITGADPGSAPESESRKKFSRKY